MMYSPVLERARVVAKVGNSFENNRAHRNRPGLKKSRSEQLNAITVLHGSS